MKAIFNREFKSYFTSMIGPVFVAALVLVTGIYFMVYNMSYGYPYFAYTLSASAIVFVLTVPLLTMRSFSEERHSKTDQLLLTSPVSVTQIVLGKFFSMAAVVAIPCVIFCLCPLIIKSTGTAYFLVDYSTILVYFLIGCAYVAIGMLISAMTESVIIAAVGTIITLLLINLSNGLSKYVPNTAIASLIGCLILLVLLCVIVYVMTKSNAATFGLLIGGAAVLIILYVVKPALFEGLVPGMIENIAFAKVMTSFVSDYVFDVKDVQLVKDGTTIDMEKEVTQEPATEEETTENASEEAETGSEVSEEETTKAVSDSTEEGLTEEESTVEMVDVTHWVFTQDNKTQRVDESDDIHDLLVNMVGLTFNDCADYYADEEEKESYGLTDGATVLTITYQSGEEETTLKLTIGATTEDDAYYYVSMDDSDQVNTVSKESLDAVLDAISGYEM